MNIIYVSHLLHIYFGLTFSVYTIEFRFDCYYLSEDVRAEAIMRNEQYGRGYIAANENPNTLGTYTEKPLSSTKSMAVLALLPI